eukprot:CAMPEP_0119033382 /NCGR_PEP_ID=MMETSP1177-20130426/430_1 /TAXON_ID=2985 /ORGANISM="Ochromonas sp, Strain CCMP1899" /LENGTH=320 /DNA_ID=CAMNT_0006990097 /DNA_START=146 /DNA_END=1108 /DNA_ORIENTATION=+
MMSTSLKGKHFMCIAQLTNDELNGLINHSIDLKRSFKEDNATAKAVLPLQGVSMSMIFQKRSTRTRVSTETGMFLLGGHGLMLGPQDVQLGVNESMKDTAMVLSRFNKVILARVFGHADVAELAEHSSVPVINALSDLHHPLQTLADLMTLKEHFGDLKGKTVAWVGDGNNVLHDLMVGAIKMGMNMNISTPKGYEANPTLIAQAKILADQENVSIMITNDPNKAVSGANVIVTDTWISMGEEDQAKQKKIDFHGYQVNTSLFSLASPDCVFLHCLPRKQEEVTDEIFYSEKSLAFPEAENRMWTVMAITMEVLGHRWGK